MFCSQCGNQLNQGSAFCDACGASIANGEGAQARQGAFAKGRATQASVKPNNGEYLSYEYTRTTVKSGLAQAALDSYESLGYELTSSQNSAPTGQTTLAFRRSRKVTGRAQLMKIQRIMDDLLANIANLEAEKTRKATAQSIAIGIVFALILGAGMALTMEFSQFMLPGIVIGCVGLLGCIYTYFHYRKVCTKESARVAPQITSAYDKLAGQCEEAQAVLRAQAI